MHYVTGAHGRMRVGAVILLPGDEHETVRTKRRAGLVEALAAWLLGDAGRPGGPLKGKAA